MGKTQIVITLVIIVSMIAILGYADDVESKKVANVLKVVESFIRGYKTKDIDTSMSHVSPAYVELRVNKDEDKEIVDYDLLKSNLLEEFERVDTSLVDIKIVEQKITDNKVTIKVEWGTSFKKFSLEKEDEKWLIVSIEEIKE